MILEHAVLQVRPGSTADFELALREAAPIIQAAAGFRSIRVQRCFEDESRYLLLVEWDSVDDHMVGFRQSPDFERWRELLHHFYEPKPEIDHYEAFLHLEPA